MDGEDHDLLVRIDERMGTVMAWQAEHMEKCHTVHKDHERRIRGVESWKYKEAGAVSLLSVLWPWLKDKLFP